MAKKFVRTTKEVWDNKNDKSQYNDSIVFIEDTKQIWSNDIYYGASNNQNSIDITYSELVSLRDNSQLIPGMQYRIIDYVTTTIQEGTRSAGHQFSIIVTADSENVLSDIARASNEYIIKTLSDRAGFENDGGSWTYVNVYEYNFNMYYMYKFNGTHPITNQDCYILINKLNPIDTGVDYLLAYDYISIDNKQTWQDGNINTLAEYLSTPIIRMEYSEYNALLYFANSDLSSWELKYSLDNDTTRFAWADIENGNGVIYYMKDEFNNECPYDFKNIQFKRDTNWFTEHETWCNSVIGFVPESDMYFYTFSWLNENNGIEDLSIIGNSTLTNDEGGISGVYNNVIKEYSDYKTISKLTLPNNIFVSSYNYDISINYCCCGNILNINCESNTFGNECFMNTFGNNCCSNTFGNVCFINTFGDYCLSNSFGNNCYSNSFGNVCESNTFGDDCFSNTFGDGCLSNTFGDGFFLNSLDNFCQYNTFVHSNSMNSFGRGCCNNSFGNNCYNNSFGNNCESNTFGDYCLSNSFGNDCNTNSFRMSDSTDGALRNYYCYNHFDDGCSYNIIWNDGTASSSYKLQNMYVNAGVSGTLSSYNIINVTELNANYKTNIAKKSNGKIVIYNEADLIADQD